TATSLPTLSVPTPPVKVVPVPPGKVPLVGWFEYDVQDPTMQYQGQWDLFTGSYHSMNRHYKYTNDDGARLTLRFLGAAVRLRCVKYYTYGVFQVRLDGQVITTIDSYYPRTTSGDGDFVTTDV